jgi:prophage maintenance system killer protein
MEYLTTHDLIWINEMVTGRVQPYNYVTLESCMAAQYAYGSSGDPVPQAANLLNRMLTQTPFLEGNRRAAFIAVLTLLNANGYVVRFTDTQAAQAVEAVAEGRMSAVQAVTDMTVPAAADMPMGVTLRKLITHECNLHAEALRLLTVSDGPVVMKR